MLFRVADAECRGSPEDAARKIHVSQDFRTGRLGPVSLQLAPQKSDNEGQVKVETMRGVAALDAHRGQRFGSNSNSSTGTG